MRISAALFWSWKAGLTKDRPTVNPTLVSWLDIVLTGGMWPPTRVGQTVKTRRQLSSDCPRCGAYFSDSYHMLWSCPSLSSLAEKFPIISRTQYLSEQSKDLSFQCYWLRGLAPLAWSAPHTLIHMQTSLCLVGPSSSAKSDLQGVIYRWVWWPAFLLPYS